ncbi:NUDIX domain-containing protein, partial [Thioclava sp. BHET1]
MEDAVETEDRAAQVAGLCWRLSNKKVEVLLVTSRDTGRWIIPKGWTMKGKSKAEAALQEAYEEAGVEGSHGKAIGDYAYVKLVDP